MLDYKGIEALFTVQDLQSFESAAKLLHITQSAVSQRIKGLERYYGKPVLTRKLPYRLTELGQQLVGHYKRLCMLECDVQKQIGKSSGKAHISVALNRDSLETWFFDFIEDSSVVSDVSLEVITDDQELTLDYLRNGLVSACLSTQEKEVQGGRVAFLGEMEYVLVASPDFAKKYFPRGKKEELKKAPALRFDQKDRLHERYLEKFFDIDGRDLNYHVVPSVHGFRKFALLGHGYALIPKIDIVDELKNKKLVRLYKNKTWKVPLYWHYSNVESKFHKEFNQEIIEWAKIKLQRT